MIASWLAFPALLVLVAVGCGLALEAASGRRLPGELIPATGLAVALVLGASSASSAVTASLTVPLVAAVAITGFGLALRTRRSLRPDPWLAGAALVVGIVYGAPAIASGEPSFLGYLRLDDTATWLALTDRVMEAGRSLDGLAPSSYEATLAFNLADGYPIGIFVPLGLGTALTGIDPAWLVQPYLSLLAALLVPVLAWLARPLVAARPARAGVAALAAQPALLVGFAHWGGVKELAAALLVPVVVALALPLARSASERASTRESRLRLPLPLAAACAAVVAVLSPAGLIWLAPALLAALALAWRAAGPAEALRRAAATAGLTLLLCITVLVGAGSLLPPTSSPLTSDSAQGNLFAPLGVERLAGIWPAGDFRGASTAPLVTDVLIWIVLLGAAAGLVVAWRRRATGLLLYVAGTLVACAVLLALGSPWVDAKALATASPALPLAALASLAALAGRLVQLAIRTRSGRTVRIRAVDLRAAVCVLMLAAVGAGVAWSNALAHRDAHVAPYEQLAELEEVGELIEGQAPTLMTEYQPYGVRHFLRKADPEGVSELRRRRIPLRSGGMVPKGANADTDELSPGALQVYRTLVLRRSPSQSRPPAVYRRVWTGEHYEVWQRPARATPIGARLPLGEGLDPTGRLDCRELAGLLADEPGANLLAARRQRPVVVSLDRHAHSAGEGRWAALPASGAPVRAEVSLPRSGRWSAWLAGSVHGRAELEVDGRRIGSANHFLNNYGFFVPLGAAELRRGVHRLELRAEGHRLDLRLGAGVDPIGPLVLSASDPGQAHLLHVPAERARELCGRRWDWVEASP